MTSRFVRPASLAVALLVAGTLGVQAFDKPAPSPDKDVPALVPSHISATMQFGMRAIYDALERRIPRRLATFNDRTQSCWQRRVLGREVNIDCEYSGYVERTGPLELRAEGDRLVGAVPLYGTVTASGTHGILGLIRGTAEGQMMVFVDSRPRLRPDWSVALNLSEGYRWMEPPILHVLGFSINLTRYVEPRIREQLAVVQGDVAAKVRELDLRARAEQAWRRAFTAVKLVDEPAIWLRTTPQTVAFSGIRARGDVLEGSIEIGGTAETVIAPDATAPDPTPLPALGEDVREPGRFDVVVPIQIDYAAIRQKFMDALKDRAQGNGVAIKDISVYPADGKIVVAVETEPATPGGSGDSGFYLVVTPTVDIDGKVLNLSDLVQGGDTTPQQIVGKLLNSEAGQALRQDLHIRFQELYDKFVASADARLTRPLGDGFRSEGELTSASLLQLLPLDGGLRIDLRATGRLSILYGL